MAVPISVPGWYSRCYHLPGKNAPEKRRKGEELRKESAVEKCLAFSHKKKKIGSNRIHQFNIFSVSSCFHYSSLFNSFANLTAQRAPLGSPSQGRRCQARDLSSKKVVWNKDLSESFKHFQLDLKAGCLGSSVEIAFCKCVHRYLGIIIWSAIHRV